MTYRGYIKSGKVVLAESVDLPDGTEVQVSAARAPRTGRAERAGSRRTGTRKAKQATTAGERFASIVGLAGELPADMAAQHDHYARGTPKRR